MRSVKIFALAASIIILVGLLYTLFYTTAHENWYPIRTNSLANEPIENLARLDSKVLAEIVVDVSKYNSYYVDGASRRIKELKCALIVSIVMLLIFNVLLGLNVFRAKQ